MKPTTSISRGFGLTMAFAGLVALLPASNAVAQTTTAAISWAPGGHIRVYTCDGTNVTEKGWDGEGPWYVGSFKAQGRAVSATSWVGR